MARYPTIDLNVFSIFLWREIEETHWNCMLITQLNNKLYCHPAIKVSDFTKMSSEPSTIKLI